ncbi:hypothetical protein KA005_08610 [bacterium]|nr:hypothetical protein [bacterium]
MGCDIHIYTEKKDHNGVWGCADFYEVNKYYDKLDEDEWEQEYSHVDFYRGRNYELFGALAGVRSGTNKFIPPKGVPSDASKECLADFERWNSDAHTPSWLTLAEIKQLRKDQGELIKRSGMISQKQMDELKDGKTPDSWCGWTNADSYVQAEWEEKYNPMDGFIESLDDFINMRYWSHEVKSMDDSDFRVVFWFDN